MKIEYEFADGESTMVEVDDTIGTVILESRRLEKNQAERERYHCYSLDGAVYEGEDYERATKAVNDHVDIEDRDEVPIRDSIGRMQNTPIINESGLYSLILSSKLPKAKRFKRWITSEVLPSIRKNGVYAIDEVLKNPVAFLKVVEELNKERENSAIQQQQISELKPKASYYDVVLNCKDLISISTIAKDYGKSAIWLNDYLHRKGVQYKQGNLWLLYQKYAERGYTSTKTQTVNGKDGQIHTKIHTYWTQKGRLFIYGLLKADGIVPIIEKAI